MFFSLLTKTRVDLFEVRCHIKFCTNGTGHTVWSMDLQDLSNGVGAILICFEDEKEAVFLKWQ